MTGTERTSPSIVAVARMYYELGLTHQEISDSLGLSRVKVTRMLAEARRVGVVQITVRGNDQPFPELVDALRGRFGLAAAWVAPTSADAERSAEAAAVMGAEALTHVLGDAKLVAVGLSATMAAAVAKLGDISRTGAGFVPAAGGYGGWLQGLNPHELAMRMADRVEGRAFGFPSPLLGETADLAAHLAGLPEVRRALEVAREADTFLSGVGGIDWSRSPLEQAINAQERAELLQAGAVGDISGRFFDAKGRAVRTSFDERVVGLSLEEMAGARRRLFLAHGQSKLAAIRGLLNGGLMTALCTDLDTAKALLA